MNLERQTPRDAHEFLARHPSARLIDVRTPVEFASVHAAGAISLPLDRLNQPETLRSLQTDGEQPLYLICKSGTRAAKAAGMLAAAGRARCVVIEGGTDAWARDGLPVVRNRRVMDLERQVRIAAGILVLAGVLWGGLIHPGGYALSALVGCGLIFAGITNFCGMGLLLAKMPWNRASGAGCATTACSSQAQE